MVTMAQIRNLSYDMELIGLDINYKEHLIQYKDRLEQLLSSVNELIKLSEE